MTTQKYSWEQFDNKISEGDAVSNRNYPTTYQSRAFASPTDIPDSATGLPTNQKVEHIYNRGAYRPIWRIRDNINSMDKVAGIAKGSVQQYTGGQFLINVSGVTASPTTTITANAVVPNMSGVMKTTSLVQIHGECQFTGSSVGQQANFAIFRDNTQIGRTYTQAIAATAAAQTVIITALDNPPAGFHTYSMQWNTNTGTLTASGLNRELQVINLQPR